MEDIILLFLAVMAGAGIAWIIFIIDWWFEERKNGEQERKRAKCDSEEALSKIFKR